MSSVLDKYFKCWVKKGNQQHYNANILILKNLTQTNIKLCLVQKRKEKSKHHTVGSNELKININN